MNQVPEEKKDSVTKTLAILGFVAIIILIVWLAIKVVAFIPGAFSSLASIADSLYNGERGRELVVSTKNSVVNSGESFTISWNDLPSSGTYGFQYECSDNVSIDLRRNGGIAPITCDTYVDLEDDTSIDVTINSRAQRFTDVAYTISYTPTDTERLDANKVITVVNATIPTGVTLASKEDAKEPKPQSGSNIVNGTNSLPSTGFYDEPAVPTSNPTQSPVETPVVEAQAYVDLAATILGVGTVNDAGVFLPRTALTAGGENAVQFEIKNGGTKTASAWGYKVALPEGLDYQSGPQADLKPQERVIITLGFAGMMNSGSETIKVTVEAKGDTQIQNNEKTLTVTVN